MPYLFVLPEIKRHIELFGSDEPYSLAFMMRTMSNIWDSRKVDDWGTMIMRSPEAVRKRIWKEYVREYELNDLEQICDDYDWSLKSKSYKENLTEAIAKEGLKEPILIILDEKGVKRIVEGHHRARVVRALGGKTISGFLLKRIGGKGNTKDMTSEEAKLMDEKRNGSIS